MIYFLDFTLFYEMDKSGLWVGYAFNDQTKLGERKSNSLDELTKLLEYDILCYYCRSDMGASYVVDKGDLEVKFVNKPGIVFADLIHTANIDYSQDGTVLTTDEYDGRKTQFRVNVKPYKRYSLCKIIGIYVEPNLLAIG